MIVARLLLMTALLATAAYPASAQTGCGPHVRVIGSADGCIAVVVLGTSSGGTAVTGVGTAEGKNAVVGVGRADGHVSAAGCGEARGHWEIEPGGDCSTTGG